MSATADPLTDVADRVLDSLSDEALARLAERLAPRLTGLGLSLAGEPRTDAAWLTTKEAAAHLGMSVSALHKLTAARATPFQQDKPGAKCWFNRAELDQWRRAKRR